MFEGGNGPTEITGRMLNNGAVGGSVRWGLRGALQQVEVFGVSNWEEDGGATCGG